MDTNQVISPVLLQRQCDGGKGDMTEEQWADRIAMRLRGEPVAFLGCGTWFQFWLGTSCICPSCGWTYQVTQQDVEKFRIWVHTPTFDTREMEDRILRNVLARIGK
jgi:hypothetical protein